MTPVRHLMAGALALAVASPLAAQGFKHGNLTIVDPWTRQTAPGQANGGGFMTIANRARQADRLVGGSSPAAAKVEIHTMSMEGGIMRMRPLPNGLAVPARGRLELKPGSHHIMLIGLRKPLRLGTRVPLTLRFQHGGTITVQLKVEQISYGTGAGA
ncbi:copper chaperone PCu(A)C [Sphingomonas koreensis]